MGFRTKHSKAQAPDREHVLQGVSAKFTAEGVTLAPMAKIIQQLLEIIKGMLANHHCAPEEARRLKSTLLSRQSSARGRAALGPRLGELDRRQAEGLAPDLQPTERTPGSSTVKVEAATCVSLPAPSSLKERRDAAQSRVRADHRRQYAGEEPRGRRLGLRGLRR